MNQKREVQVVSKELQQSEYYRFCISAVMAALSSAKRSPRRVWVVMDLVTHRLMQPDSRPERALEVKSSTQALKQLSTRLPKTWRPRLGSG
jgi:ribosomal protein L28